MALDREALYVALFTRLAAVSGLVTSNRRLVPVNKVTPAEQPALFLAVESENAKYSSGMPLVWTLRAAVVVYVYTGTDQASAPSTVLNPILKGIEQALEWAPGDALFGMSGPGTPTNLAGKCTHVRILGTQISEGVESGQCVAIVDLEIQATAGGPP